MSLCDPCWQTLVDANHFPAQTTLQELIMTSEEERPRLGQASACKERRLLVEVALTEQGRRRVAVLNCVGRAASLNTSVTSALLCPLISKRIFPRTPSCFKMVRVFSDVTDAEGFRAQNKEHLTLHEIHGHMSCKPTP